MTRAKQTSAPHPKRQRQTQGPARPWSLSLTMDRLEFVLGTSHRSAELSTRRPILDEEDGEKRGEQSDGGLASQHQKGH